MLGRVVGRLTGRALRISSPLNARRSIQLKFDTINDGVRQAQYAVRGAIVLRAMQHEEALKRNEKRPFDKIVYCNIGNPQQVGQKPITFFRQVLSILDNPDLMQEPHASKFPADVIKRCRDIYARTPGGTGAYSESKGLAIIREDVAKFISERDGNIPIDPENVFLTDGASHGVKKTLNIVIRGPQDAVLLPIPQYPLYTATISLLNGKYVGYYLDEDNGWSLDIQELQRAYDEGKKSGYTMRALVVINPGNPTGQALPEENLKDIVRFCEKHDLLLMADEVYQQNVYRESKFTSFRKVVHDLNSKVELLSFHSVSKGVVGECGRRGGYLEIHNIDPLVAEEIYKMFSIGLCANVAGQSIVSLMVNPPKPGDESYALYTKEVTELLAAMERKSAKLEKALNKMKNITCAKIEGAMYAFPRIHLPEKAIAEAKRRGMQPDAMYCIEMLDATGVCTVPGSGFHQKPGTYHFRTTFLPPDAEMDIVIEKLAKFNEEFMKKYE